MKNLSFILILLVTLPMFFVVSCASDKSDDGTPPTIFGVRFNVNDTIYYMDEGVKKKITLNNSKTVKEKLNLDTLVIGKRLRFAGSFADEGGLSTAFFHIWGDTLIVNDKDASYNMKRLMPILMFGKTEMAIDTPGVVLADPIPLTVKSKDMLSNLTVRSSRTSNYYFSIRCADITSNVDTTSYLRHEIILLTREEVIAVEKAKKNISHQE